MAIFTACLLLFLASPTFTADYLNYTIHADNMGYALHRKSFGPAYSCPGGKGVTGFRLRFSEDKKLTGVQMICQDGTKLGPEVVKEGKWKEWEYCDGEEKKDTSNFAIGYNYRSKNGHSGTQLKMKCSNVNGATEIGPMGFDEGDWSARDFSGCSTSAKFCGFAAEKDDKRIGRVKFLCCSRVGEPLSADGDWKPFGKDICIGGGHENYGFFRMPSSGFISAMKFVYVDGILTCNKNNPGLESRFGCEYLKRAFSIFVTTSRREQILPDSNQYYAGNDCFYTVLGKDGRKADDFTLLAANPTYVNGNDEIRVYYGEDYKDRHEHDNGDSKVCVNVYGKVL